MLLAGAAICAHGPTTFMLHLSCFSVDGGTTSNGRIALTYAIFFFCEALRTGNFLENLNLVDIPGFGIALQSVKLLFSLCAEMIAIPSNFFSIN